MFEGLSARLSDVLDKLTRRGALTEGDLYDINNIVSGGSTTTNANATF